MAKTICNTATYDGHAFKRVSARTYSHTVIVPGSIAADRAKGEASVRRGWQANLRYCQAQARGQFVCRTHEERQTRIRKAMDWVALGEQGHVDAYLADFDKRHAGKPDLYYWNAGWCGRHDLALKLASKYAGSIVLEVKA